MKKISVLLLCAVLCFSFCACGGGGAAGKDGSFENTKWETYEGYGVKFEYPSSWTLYAYTEADAAIKTAVLAVNAAEDIFIRFYVDILGELHVIVSYSENEEAELFSNYMKEKAAISASFPAQPDYYNDDSVFEFIDAIEQLGANPENPLEGYAGALPEKAPVTLEAVKVTDDGSLASAVDPKSGLYGYIDRTGAWVIAPAFTSAGTFSQGRAHVLYNGEKAYKFIDETGAVVIEGAYSEGYTLELTNGAYVKPFSEGYAAVYINNGYAQDQVYLDTDGNIVIDAEYVPKLEGASYGNAYCFDVATAFHDGLAAVMRGRNTAGCTTDATRNHAYIIDTTGHVVAAISKAYSVDTDGFDPNGLIGISTGTDYIGDGEVGLCDARGNVVVACDYEILQYGDNGLYCARKDGVYGFIDKTGAVVIDFVYENAKTFTDGLAAVRKNGKWGFIDADGNYGIEPVYDDVYALNRNLIGHLYGAAFSCGVAAVKIGDYWGIIDTEGKIVVDFGFVTPDGEYNACPFTSCSHDLICYSDGELCGLITTDGKLALEPTYSSIGSFYDAR